MFEIEYFESEIKQSQASPLAKCFQDEMNAVTQRAKTAQKYLLDMYCALSSSETSTTPSVSLQSASSSVVSMSISTRSSTPTFSDLGPPSIGEQTDNDFETDSMEQLHGTLYRWAVDKVSGEKKNFGFIKCPKLKKEVFVHKSNLCLYPEDMPIPSKVTFLLSEDKSKRIMAINVRLYCPQ